MALNVGELVAYLRLDDTQFNAALQRVQGNAQAAGNAAGNAFNGATQGATTAGAAANNAAGGMGNLGRQAGAASSATANVGASAGIASKALAAMGGLLAGAALVDYVKDAVNASSDLNETISKSQQIFGDAAGAVADWGQTAATSVGLSRSAALEAATNFGNVFTQIGFTSQAAADLSTKTVQMAADLGSFNNLPTADVADKISGAFNGEYDSIQALIPSINAARVESEAMAATGKTSAAALTAQDKATAVLTIITKDGSKAMGDFARTSSGFANQSKITAATIDDQKAALGDKLMPVVQTLMGLISSVGIPVLGGFGEAFGAVAEFLAPLLAGLGDAITWFSGLPAPVIAATLAIAGVALLSGPLTALWTNIKTGALAARTAFVGAAAGATGAAAGMNVMSAAATRVGTALKAAFVSNPIGLALIGITTAITLFAGSTEDAVPPVADFASAVDEATGALKENAQAVLSKTLADRGSLEAARAIGVAADVYTLAVMGNKEAIDQVNAAIAAGTITQYDTELGYITSTTEAATAAQKTFASDTGGLNGAMDKAKLAIQGAAGATTEQKTAAEDAKPAVKELSGAIQDQEKANKDLETAVRNVMAILDEQQHRNDPTAQFNAAEATRGIAQAFRDQAQAGRDVTQANIDYQAAQENLSKVQKDGKSTANDVAEAHLKVASAADAVRDAEDKQAASSQGVFTAGEDVRKSYIEQAKEAYNAALATGGVEGAQAAAQGKIEGLTASLYAQLTASGLSDTQARDYITSLGLIPATVATNITVDSQTAEQKLAALQARINLIISSGAKASGATGGIGVTTTGDIKVRGGTLTRAEGGAVYGPGSPTSDSVNARLSNGEHVLTAADVVALGGQSAVYALRRSLHMAQGGAVESVTLPRFANGGAVAQVSAGGSSAKASVTYIANVNHYGPGEVTGEVVLTALKELERTHAF